VKLLDPLAEPLVMVQVPSGLRVSDSWKLVDCDEDPLALEFSKPPPGLVEEVCDEKDACEWESPEPEAEPVATHPPSSKSSETVLDESVSEPPSSS
jgi:hypothetical protein